LKPIDYYLSLYYWKMTLLIFHAIRAFIKHFYWVYYFS